MLSIQTSARTGSLHCRILARLCYRTRERLVGNGRNTIGGPRPLRSLLLQHGLLRAMRSSFERVQQCYEVRSLRAQV
jgi:hypothetical protein